MGAGLDQVASTYTFTLPGTGIEEGLQTEVPLVWSPLFLDPGSEGPERSLPSPNPAPAAQL